MDIKVTRPEDKCAKVFSFEDAVERFEQELSAERRGKSHYKLTLYGTVSNEDKQCIEKLYRDAGWDVVNIYPSVEGATGLVVSYLYLTKF